MHDKTAHLYLGFWDKRPVCKRGKGGDTRMTTLQKYEKKLDNYYARKEKLEDLKSKKQKKIDTLESEVSIIDAKLTLLDSKIKKFETCKNFLQKNCKGKIK